MTTGGYSKMGIFGRGNEIVFAPEIGCLRYRKVLILRLRKDHPDRAAPPFQIEFQPRHDRPAGGRLGVHPVPLPEAGGQGDLFGNRWQGLTIAA